jgi:hypothetical protein
LQVFSLREQFLLRTASDDFLGSGKWGAGPTIVVLTMPGRFVLGVLASKHGLSQATAIASSSTFVA